MKKIHPIFDFFNKENFLAQYLGHFVLSKKGLNKIGSKIALQYGFTFWTFFENLDFPKSLLAPLCNGATDAIVLRTYPMLLGKDFSN